VLTPKVIRLFLCSSNSTFDKYTTTSRTVRPRIDWKLLALYLLLVGVTAFFVGMYVVGTLHTGLYQFYPR